MSNILEKSLLEKIAAIVTIIGFPIAIAGIFIAQNQIATSNSIASQQNSIAFTSNFRSSQNVGIFKAIDNASPILIEKGGEFSETELDIYLNEYDDLYDAYNSEQLNIDDLCSFSSYVEATYENQEINDYLHQYPEYFNGLKNLENLFSDNSSNFCRIKKTPSRVSF